MVFRPSEADDSQSRLRSPTKTSSPEFSPEMQLLMELRASLEAEGWPGQSQEFVLLADGNRGEESSMKLIFYVNGYTSTFSGTIAAKNVVTIDGNVVV